MLHISRRAAECKNWRWMRGMRLFVGGLLDCPERIEWADPDGTGYYRHCHTDKDDLPDLTDPATIGCLLALVREVWGDPNFYVAPSPGSDGFWEFNGTHRSKIAIKGTACSSEADALVSALEFFI